MEKLDLSLAKEGIDMAVAGNGVVSKIYQHYLDKYIVPDKYLAEQIKMNGALTESDVEKAARLYLIPKMHREYKNVAKIILDADAMYIKNQNNEENEVDIDVDWLSYFIDRASLIEDEDVQKIWSYILASECACPNSFRKVMLDRLALLDRKTAIAFGNMCMLTFNVSVSDDRDYSIPLYIRRDTLSKMVNSKKLVFTADDAVQYCELLPAENELELLQEIGLISLSDECDEGNIYSLKKISFNIIVGTGTFSIDATYDKKQKIYYLPTGNAVYTGMGLALFNILKSQYKPNDKLYDVVKSFLYL